MARTPLAVFLLLSVSSVAHAQEAPQEAWAKRCHVSTVPGGEKVGKEEPTAVIRCETYRHQTDPDSDMRLIVAQWQALNQDGRAMSGGLQVTVPLGSPLNAVVRVRVLREDEWGNADKSVKYSEGEDPARSLTLPYAYCSRDGCVARAEVASGFAASLKEGGGLVVEMTGASGRSVTFRVPLAGFEQALQGRLNCGTVLDDTGPCNARALLKGWRP